MIRRALKDLRSALGLLGAVWFYRITLRPVPEWAKREVERIRQSMREYQ